MPKRKRLVSNFAKKYFSPIVQNNGDHRKKYHDIFSSETKSNSTSMIEKAFDEHHREWIHFQECSRKIVAQED